MKNKTVLLKSLRLEKCFIAYKEGSLNLRRQTFEKFEQVWGKTLANHFLGKYEDAESLIWALDQDNLALFILNF